MSLVLSDNGAQDILDVYLGATTLTLKFFTNNVTPADTDVSGDYTEATGGGYAAKTLVAGGWTIAGDPKTASFAQQVFTFTGALTGNPTIYGYWIENGVGTLIWDERFAAAFTPINNGDHADVTPKVQASKGTPA